MALGTACPGTSSCGLIGESRSQELRQLGGVRTSPVPQFILCPQISRQAGPELRTTSCPSRERSAAWPSPQPPSFLRPPPWVQSQSLERGLAQAARALRILIASGAEGGSRERAREGWGVPRRSLDLPNLGVCWLLPGQANQCRAGGGGQEGTLPADGGASQALLYLPGP